MSDMKKWLFLLIISSIGILSGIFILYIKEENLILSATVVLSSLVVNLLSVMMLTSYGQ